MESIYLMYAIKPANQVLYHVQAVDHHSKRAAFEDITNQPIDAERLDKVS